MKPIDTNFDFRSDTPPGRDPDSFSPTLRKYHKLLWSKPLPCGVVFDLIDTKPKAYLHHQSEKGEYFLSSDTVIPSFTRQKRIAPIIEPIPKAELDAFNTIGYTIGGMMIFPGNKIDGKMTINGARGLNHQIKDRFDLTLECIRRHYLNGESPLDETLNRYKAFFALFENFSGYVDFFLLNDLVTDDLSAVNFFSPFQDFNESPLPLTTEEYTHYMKSAVQFIECRNHRISLG
jgi:hypothetical protein